MVRLLASLMVMWLERVIFIGFVFAFPEDIIVACLVDRDMIYACDSNSQFDKVISFFHSMTTYLFFQGKKFRALGLLSNFQLDLEAERDPWKSIEPKDIKQGICIA